MAVTYLITGVAKTRQHASLALFAQVACKNSSLHAHDSDSEWRLKDVLNKGVS
jgi:hypothetical protein